MKNYMIKIIGLMCCILIISGCSTKSDEVLEKKIMTPESIEIYDISVNNVYSKADNRTLLLKGFPFISNEPIFNFNGKFSHQFYDKLDYRYKFSHLKDVDFWKLRTNPFLEDFIYVLPTWANKFQRVSDDLFQNISYSYNLSLKEQEILKWWIGNGGILWIEGGIYSTRYDTFKKNGEIDSKEIVKKIVKKSKNLNFFDKKVNTYIYKSKKIDFVNYVPLEIKFATTSDVEYFKDIKNLKIQTKNFLSADFLPKSKKLLISNNGKTLVSFVSYGTGGVVFIRPFEFKNKRYDGELLRWKLLYYLLNKMYLSDKKGDNSLGIDEKLKISQSIKEKFDNNKSVVLNAVLFEIDSYKLKKGSLEFLKPIAKYLNTHKNIYLLISGHTDNTGVNKYNKILSKNRANSIKEALIKMKVNEKFLLTKGYGYDKPIATNKTKKGRALNRRVEFKIMKR